MVKNLYVLCFAKGAKASSVNMAKVLLEMYGFALANGVCVWITCKHIPKCCHTTQGANSSILTLAKVVLTLARFCLGFLSGALRN
jgi:hypothetical protein